MPKRDRAAYMVRYRARKLKEKRPPAVKLRKIPTDPAGQVRVLANWAAENLKVPPGHPLSGQWMTLPPFFTDFLLDALSHRWSLLSCARKNIKSAGVCGPGARLPCGAAALARLAGVRGFVVEGKGERVTETD